MFIFKMSGYYGIYKINTIQTFQHAGAVQESENEFVSTTSIQKVPPKNNSTHVVTLVNKNELPGTPWSPDIFALLHLTVRIVTTHQQIHKRSSLNK